MANNVIGLFESKSVADQVAEELKTRGFNERNVNRFEGDQGDLENELEREGVTDTDASYYAEGLRQGGALVSVRAEDDQVDEAVEIMNRYAGSDEAGDTETMGTETRGTETDYAADEVDYTAEGTTPGVGTTGLTGIDTGTTSDVTGATTGTTGADETHLDVVEEQLRVGKRDVQRGGMRVRRVVTERPVEEQVVLRDETIRVDRQTVDRTLDGTNSANADLFTEKTYEFTETDEEAVVAKETHVVEEVVVGKDVEERTETVHDTVRRADVEIEELGQSYGQSLAGDTRYENREWHEFEDEARADYERDNQDGRSWDEVKDSMRSSWEESRNRR